MGELSQLQNFWASILRETVVDELKSTLAVTDVEEKAIQLLSRVLFLLVMEIKHERDLVQEKYQNLLKDIGSTNAQANYKEIAVESSSDSTVKKAVSSSKPDSESEDDENIVNGSIDVEEACVSIDFKTVVNSEKQDMKLKLKRNRNMSSPTQNPNCKNLINTSGKLPVDILFAGNRNDCYVAETMDLAKEDSEPYKERITVPETMAMCPDGYGNTDFFEEITSPLPGDAEDNVDSFTPVKELPKRTGDTPLFSDTSPVLGKVKRNGLAESPNIRRFDIDGKTDASPKVSKSKGLEMSTPGKGEETEVHSTSRYSPLNFTVSPVTASPSLLTKCITEKKDAEKECSSPISPSIISIAVLNSNKAKKKTGPSLDRSASVRAAGPSRELRKNMKRTSSCLEERKSYEITLSPPDSKRKRRYRQTKLTDLPRETGRQTLGEVTCHDEDLEKAIKESLKSKTVEDMMRKKTENLHLEIQGNKQMTCRSPAKRSTLAAQNRNRSPQKLIKSPQKLERSPQELLRSPQKLQQGPQDLLKSPQKPRKSPQKLLKSPQVIQRSPQKKLRSPQVLVKSPKKLMKSPQKKQSSSVKSPRKDLNQKLKIKKKNLKALEKEESTSSQSSLLNTEELIANINDSAPPAEPQPMRELSKTPLQKKQSSRIEFKKSKSKLMQDSFDLLPKPDSVDFAYQNDPVRKKTERQQLPGWKCQECEQWYEGQKLSDSEKRRMINKCSRHRAKHNPVTNTPPGFWKPDWDDDD